MTDASNQDLIEGFCEDSLELLQEIGEDLLALEASPDEIERINKIFRAVHTLKGSAGFLDYHPIVEICHRIENLFEYYRTKQYEIDDMATDLVLQSVDNLQDAFAKIVAGESPDAPPKTLIDTLDKKLASMAADGAEEATICHDEFERLLDARDEKVAAEEAAPVSEQADEAMSDEEFEKLLDQRDARQQAVENQEQPITLSQALAEAEAEEADAREKEKEKEEQAHHKDHHHTVRVDTQVLDEIMNLGGELVLIRDQLASMVDTNMQTACIKSINMLDNMTSRLQIALMRTRMQPASVVLGKLPRMVRDLAKRLGKQVRLTMAGEHTLLDKSLLEHIADPLMHIIRNAIDHGIESPEVRVEAHKPRSGSLTVSVEQKSNSILLIIEDDGGGIDVAKIRKRALENNLVTATALDAMNDTACYQFIFEPGFSTRDEVSEVSGRGVGLDIVKSNINHLNGTIFLKAKLGVGCRFEISLPLTLAIVTAILIEVQGQVFCAPTGVVQDVHRFDASRVVETDTLRYEYEPGWRIPLYRLDQCLGFGTSTADTQINHILVVKDGVSRVAYAVDQLIGQQDIVIKPLDEYVREIPGYSGATILESGQLALIIDFPRLLSLQAGYESKPTDEPVKTADTESEW